MEQMAAEDAAAAAAKAKKKAVKAKRKAQAKEKTKKSEKGPEKKTVRIDSKKDRPGISARDPDGQAAPTIQVGESKFDNLAAADVAAVFP